MLTVLLLSLAWELVREELNRVHRLDEVIHVMLRKVTTKMGIVSCLVNERMVQVLYIHP